MTKKIFRSIFAVALTVFLACLIIIMGALYEYFSSTQMNQLKTQTELAAAGVELSGTDYLNKLSAKDYRITLIESDGTVIFDSSASTATMENHLQRAEIKEALANGFGQSTRYSSTLMERQLYCCLLYTSYRKGQLSDHSGHGPLLRLF